MYAVCIKSCILNDLYSINVYTSGLKIFPEFRQFCCLALFILSIYKENVSVKSLLFMLHLLSNKTQGISRYVLTCIAKIVSK